MAKHKKGKKKAGKLEADIKSALSSFAKGIESKKLEKKINKHSADIAELISKLKQPAKKKKAKTPRVKKAITKPEKKVVPSEE